MAAGVKDCGSVLSLPPPRPKSPPEYPDLFGKRRELGKVQMLEREIGFLREELKSIEGIEPASRSCKELADFVTGNLDPLLPARTTKGSRRSCCCCSWKKWICALPRLLFSCICCNSSCHCCSSSSSACPHPEPPSCCKTTTKCCNKTSLCSDPCCGCCCFPDKVGCDEDCCCCNTRLSCGFPKCRWPCGKFSCRKSLPSLSGCRRGCGRGCGRCFRLPRCCGWFTCRCNLKWPELRCCWWPKKGNCSSKECCYESCCFCF